MRGLRKGGKLSIAAVAARAIDGLVFSRAITLFITPVIYLALDRFSGHGPVTTPES